MGKPTSQERTSEGTRYRFKDTPPVTVKGQVGRVKKKKPMWERAMSAGRAALDNVITGYNPKTKQAHRVKDIGK